MGKKSPIQHVEWRTKDAARLKSFYGDLFGWKFKDVMDGAYTMVNTGNKEIGAGIFKLEATSQIPPGVSSYIAVKDLAPVEQKIQALGGKVLMSKQEVPQVGWFSMFADVDGNLLAIWQQMDKQTRKAEKKAAQKAKKAGKKKA